ncbi:MAG: ATPase, T2SS/T4P/T4SS family [Planctomycetaceae bacterium]|nr:Flp pilus assembly complex ATPase component TadA [Planctomycetaceae bacterium]
MAPQLAHNSTPPAAGHADDAWPPAQVVRVPPGPHRWLLDNALVTPEQVEQALEFLKDHPKLTVLAALVRTRAIDALTACKAVAGYFNLPYLALTAADVDVNLLSLAPLDYLKSKRVIPVSREGEDILVALADPADIFLIDDLKRRLGWRLRLAVASGEDILRVLEELTTSPAQQVEEIIRDIADDDVEVVSQAAKDVADLERIAGESPVIRYVNYLISAAVRDAASDIHIEPGEKRLKVRYRIDGMLFEQQAPPLAMHAAVLSRLKIMANLNIAERRLPQDGRIRAMVHGRGIDLRVSTLPMTHGEKCVIRILDNTSITVGLENLGMNANTLEGFRRHILRPHGIVLVTGPTGSGKSTTLYSALQIMDSQRQNISTVEDPVEYELATVNQVNVQEHIGMTFSAALRSLLRQDPDVVMIGEIRDQETARIAVQASLTGHMVLSTLHTNDAPSSITRLINIGVEPYLISAALNAVLAQRLVRKICSNCRQPLTDVSAPLRAYMQKQNAADVPLFVGAGCDRCRQTGYKGRVGLYELLELDEELRDLISSGAALSQIRKAALKSGMHSLRQDGLEKIAAGLTTVQEVMRITEVS